MGVQEEGMGVEEEFVRNFIQQYNSPSFYWKIRPKRNSPIYSFSYA